MQMWRATQSFIANEIGNRNANTHDVQTKKEVNKRNANYFSRHVYD